jgi:hypothetical protein
MLPPTPEEWENLKCQIGIPSSSAIDDDLTLYGLHGTVVAKD